jgi:pyrroline-5-carboxylate reductase
MTWDVGSFVLPASCCNVTIVISIAATKELHKLDQQFAPRAPDRALPSRACFAKSNESAICETLISD